MAEDTKTTEASATDIKKAESHSGLSVPLRTERGQPNVITGSHFVQDARKRQLQMPQRLCTFDCMTDDDAVFNSIDITNAMVSMALNRGQFKSSGSAKSEVAAKFLNYCIRNMTHGTWLGAVKNANTNLKYGFALLNMVTEVRTYGPYSGNRVLKALSPRDQKSVQGWVWDADNRYLKGFVQKPMLKSNRNSAFASYDNGLTLLQVGKYREAKYPYIKIEQLLHFTYNATNNNPQGDSPLVHCFDAWMEKKLIEQYELAGVAKDMGGVVVARSPSDLFERANDPEVYPTAAREKAALEKDLADLHQGKSSFIHLQSDTDERGNFLYDFELKGIDGGGKQYTTSEIITEKKKAIYNVFGTQSLLLGQSGEGSNALSKDQTTTFGYYVNNNLMEKEDVINNQLATRLLAVNNIYLDFDDMPTFESWNPYKLSHDEAGKFIQRVASVNKLTPEILKFLMEDLGAPLDGIDELNFEEPVDTGAGKSKGSSGTGDTQAGGKASENNAENGSSIDKSICFDGDKIVINGTIVNADDLDDEGNYKG